MLTRYELRTVLGSGSFGDVYLAKDRQTETQVAVKVISSIDYLSIINHEAGIMYELQDVKGVPSLHTHFPCEGKGYIVMQLLGHPILQNNDSSQVLSVWKAASSALKVMKILRRIHSHGVIHQDIKPQNILLGLDKHQHRLYLIDYGLATYHPDSSSTSSSTHSHRSKFTGTKLFSSANAYAGNAQSYRDDLEGLCNVLIWLIRRDLPWCHQTAYMHFDVVNSKKLTADEREITKGCPEQVLDYLMYVRSLRYGERPDYGYLVRLMKQMKCRNKSLCTPEKLTSAKKHSRRASTSTFHQSSPQCTPVLKPPEISLSMRQKIQQIHNSGILGLISSVKREENRLEVES